ncbi:diguanylate cyclase domain-containing protein [Desulfurispira natronophila]|uniref:Diguanylate cyclase (GGDEF)-like protein/PAS domain S-box-containing protein n=1 Tax=Desulfurispira natronophila TaxID=682562 RepID=A0A7W7Y3T0_9BACT|nr:diguanylate cyclase [Desulfurispira natronophila]MBB5021503.1 diguanylate cyclase (GGDEF)-like protein/PAS domain S-box-containing protein [Desulfurispira natronophila]
MSTPMRILAVDDSRTILTLMQQMTLRSTDFEILVADDPREALQRSHQESIDLLIVDYMMPRMDGITLMQRFKENPCHEHVPVLMITASDDVEVRHRALQSGANDFLTKPLDMLEFTTRVRNMLDLRKYQKALEENIELLRQSEERWQFAIDGSDDGVWDWNIETGEAFFSRRWKAMLGYGEEDIANHYTSWRELMHPEDLPLVLWEIQQHLQGKEPVFLVEMRLRSKDGSYKWILTRGKVVERTSDGEPRRAVGTNTDISKRKEMEDYLKDSSDRMRKILDVIDVLVFVVEMSDEGQLLFVNKNVRDLYGDIEGKSCWPYIRTGAEIEQELDDNILLSNQGSPSGENLQWETYDPERKRWHHRKERAIRWVDGSVVRMQVVSDITERKNSVDFLQRSERKYRELFDNMKSGVAIYEACDRGRDFIFKDVNKSAENILLASKEVLIGSHIREHFPGVTESGVLNMLQEAHRTQVSRHYPAIYYSDERISGYFEHFVYTLPTGEVVAIIDDVTEERLAEHELHLAAKVFDNSMDAIVITDENNRIVSVNEAFSEITGYSRDEVMGENPRILSSGLQDHTFYEEMWTSLQKSGQWKGELWNRRKSGEVYPQWASLSVASDNKGQITNYIAIFSDISERKAAEERIQYLAWHDPLTGLPNRALMQDRLERSLTLAQRNDEQLALLFVDLDRFKTINDTLGHHIGDLLLQEVSKRLLDCVRESDTVSRQGGDEFVIMLLNISGPEAAAKVAGKLIDAVAKPFIIDGNTLHTTPSIGISLYPKDGSDKQTLMKKADSAMYAAKDSGRNNYVFAGGEEGERLHHSNIEENS